MRDIRTILQAHSKHLFRFRMISLNSLIRDSEVFQIWKCEEHHVSKLKRDINQLDKHKNIIIQETDASCIVYDKGIITVVFNWSGLNDIILFLESAEIHDKIAVKIRSKLDIIKYEIEGCMTNLTEKSKRILKIYPNISIRNCGITIYDEITPEKYFDGGKLIDIPEEDRMTIRKIEIDTDPYLNIIAIRVDNKHPNADDRFWFCLGDLKLKPLTPDNIEKIRSKIKVWNLDSYYWIPDSLKAKGEHE